MSTDSAAWCVAYPERLAQLATAHPDKSAVIFAPVEDSERRLSWAELEIQSNRIARLLRSERGVGPSSVLMVALPNCPEHFTSYFAAWKLGACIMPLSAAMPEAEREAVLALAATRWNPHIIADLKELDAARSYSAGPLPPAPIPRPGIVITSGGSTGRPKIIVSDGPHAEVPVDGPVLGMPGRLGMRSGQVQLMAGPLYHGAPIAWSTRGLFHDHSVVLMERFDAAHAVHLIERHRVSWAFLVPTMMRRIVQLPDVERRNFSSIEVIWSAAGPCPAWVKQAWIDLLGPARVREAYGGSEPAGATLVTGEEWLQRPGTVGRPMEGWELRICGEDGGALPPGEVGLIRMRPPRGTSISFYYLGASVDLDEEGFVAIGDMGWVDEDGYLYIADRRADLIIAGGANIYPAEVEAALVQHPAIHDAVVIGLPHDDLGKTAHAIIQPRDPTAPPTVDELIEHCRVRLTRYKIPRSWEVVAELPRNELGKIRRTQLADERAKSN